MLFSCWFSYAFGFGRSVVRWRPLTRYFPFVGAEQKPFFCLVGLSSSCADIPNNTVLPMIQEFFLLRQRSDTPIETRRPPKPKNSDSCAQTVHTTCVVKRMHKIKDSKHQYLHSPSLCFPNIKQTRSPCFCGAIFWPSCHFSLFCSKTWPR